jgi:hypothetical protein
VRLVYRLVLPDVLLARLATAGLVDMGLAVSAAEVSDLEGVDSAAGAAVGVGDLD